MQNLAGKLSKLSTVDKIILANVIIFVLMLLMNPLQINWRFDPFSWLAPSGKAISVAGATGYIAVVMQDRWWTLITANYVHLSGIHLALNMAILFSLGRIVSLVYGESRFLVIYTLGGIVAMLASTLVRIPVTAGASGALCAIVGAVIYADWKAEGRSLAELFRSIGIWVLMLGLSGFILPNVNNWAHFAGLASGIPLGMICWRHGRMSSDDKNIFGAIASVCVSATVAAFVFQVII
jgi:rhomboid protease GluP